MAVSLTRPYTAWPGQALAQAGWDWLRPAPASAVLPLKMISRWRPSLTVADLHLKAWAVRRSPRYNDYRPGCEVARSWRFPLPHHSPSTGRFSGYAEQGALSDP